MARSVEHQAKYEQNRKFLNANGGLASMEPSWAAVVAFYAALHLVERLAAIQNIHHAHGGAHKMRAGFLRGHPKHRVIFGDYDTLRDASEIARYGTVNQFQTLFSPDTVQSLLIDTHLVAVENYVNSVFHPAPPPSAPTVGP